MKTSIPDGPGKSTPDAGTRQPAGKSSEPDAVLRTGLQPKPSGVKQAEEVKGAARKAIDIQVAGDDPNSPNGDPKQRTRNQWGTDIPKD